MNRASTISYLKNRGIRTAVATLGTLLTILLSMPLQAAFLFEIDTDGADDGVVTYNSDFTFGGDTTTASQSVTSLAFGTSGGDSIFGGDGAAEPDTYVYTHAPDSEPDNLAIPPGTDLGGGNLATGVVGGAPGLYAVYATWPFTTNVSGGDTRYEVSTAGDAFTVDIDQNNKGDEWVLLGQINYTSGDITVIQQPTEANSFISMRAYGLLFEALGEQVEPRATFTVNKFFNDGNPTEVEVRISCNTGLPLEQTANISTGDGVMFVVVDYNDGEMDCEITETAASDGYLVSYLADGSEFSELSCSFEEVEWSATHNCLIENFLQDVQIDVTKEWVDENPQFQPINVAEADYVCVNEVFEETFGSVFFSGNLDTQSFSVFPNWDGSTSCTVTESFLEGGIESDDSDCQGLSVAPGNGASCTIVNTRFFEGIPTLSRHGLTALILLMLGIGFVGLRRLV